jgi:hypothetical protein
MLYRITMAIMLCLGLASCGGGGSSGGGNTIQQSDGTPPEATLEAAATVGEDTATVSTSSGTSQSMTLHTKAGSLNLLASAKDSESGIRDLEIWIEVKVTSCGQGGCQGGNPPLTGAPRFSRTGSAKAPGENTAEQSIMLQSIDLIKEIPGSSDLSMG